MSLDPEAIYQELTSQWPTQLNQLPLLPGIYLLQDHEGNIRYVGSSKTTLHDRVYSKHVTGSEGMHKLSTAYNVGRIWRDPDDKGTDAKIAKKLRTAFIRKHCMARFVTVSPDQTEGIIKVENRVKAFLSPEMRSWNEKRFPPVPEPRDLVDALLAELRFGSAERAAVDRQDRLFGLQTR